MSFFEHVTASHNKHGDIDTYKLPCNRYMVYSKKYDKYYMEDPGVARYINAMSMFFDKFGLKDAKFDFFTLYNSQSVSKIKPFGVDRFVNYKDFVAKLALIQKVNSGNIFANFEGTCKEFYREFDENCPACAMCFYNTEKYNEFIDEEEIFISYLTSDPETFNRVKSFYRDNMDILFKSKFDLHYNKETLDYKSNKPYVFDFYKSLCSVLIQYEDLTFFTEDNAAANTDFKDSFFKYMDEVYLYSSNRDLTKADEIDLINICNEFLDRFVYRNAITKAVGFNSAYKIVTGKDINIENYNTDVAYGFPSEEDDAVGNDDDEQPAHNDIREETEENPDTPTNEAWDVSISTGIAHKTSQSEQADETEQQAYINTPDEEEEVVSYEAYDPMTDGFSPEDFEYPDEEKPQNTDDDINKAADEIPDDTAEDMNEDPNCESQITDIPVSEEYSEAPAADEQKKAVATDEDMSGNAETTALSTVGITDIVSNDDADAEYSLKEDTADTWKYPVKMLGENNYIIDNHIDNLAEYGIISIDNDKWHLMQFESSVLTNTFMCIEAVTDNAGKDYFIFFDRMRKTYFSVELNMESECMNIIKPYLTRSKYIKICYQPYHLYAFGRKYGIELKKIFSIQTCYSFFIKNRPLIGYEETINEFIDSPLSSYAPRDIPMLLVGMQMYPTICSRCSKKLNDPAKLSEVDAMRYFDEALGRSYYVGDLYETTGDIPPFKLTGPNKYEFTTIDRGKTLVEGEYFTCTFSLEQKYDTTEDDCWAMIKGAIETLASKGRFRKLHIYITNMTKTTLKLFVPKYNVSYMETSLMSVFSEVNRLRLGNKKYKMLIRQDATELADSVKEEQGEQQKTIDDEENESEKV